MTTIVAIADAHLGNHRRFGGTVRGGINERGHLTIKALRHAADRALELEVDALVSCGDFFDVARPEPAIVTAAQRAVERVPFVALLGNHEMGEVVHVDAGWVPGDEHAADATALGPLAPIATVVGAPRSIAVGDVDLLMIPFGYAIDDATIDAIDGRRDPARTRVLCIHAGVRDEDTAFFLRDATDAIDMLKLDQLCRTHEIDAVLAGNWHNARSWVGPVSSAKIVQIGALAPTGFGEEGDGYGWMAVLQTGGPERVQIRRERVPGPRFRTVDMAAARAGVPEVEPGCLEMVRLMVADAELPEARAAADLLRSENRSIEVSCVGGSVDLGDLGVDVDVRGSMTTDRIIEAIVRRGAAIAEDVRADAIALAEDCVLRPLADRLMDAIGDDDS